MRAVVRPQQGRSVAGYLAGEHDGERRHEYGNGRVLAMTGASRAPDTIAVEIAVEIVSALYAHLRGSPCRVPAADVKLRVDRAADRRCRPPDLPRG